MVPSDELVARLRAAGCVYAEEEAVVLVEAAGDDELEPLVRRRIEGEPLEHIVGWVAFGSLRLAIGTGVFVPRRRSARLARAAVRVAGIQERPVVLEAYSGIAPLAASVAAAVPAAEIHACDSDPRALRWARENLPPDAGVHLADGLAGLPARLSGGITLIAAVPPYVPVGDAALIPRDARAHEPAIAFFAGDDGLDRVRELIGAARDWLAPGGRVLVELGRRQGRAATAAARRAGYRASYRTGPDGQTALLDLRAPPAALPPRLEDHERQDQA